MKKSFALIAILAVLTAISACGNSGENGRTLARIDGSAFTEGHLDLRLSAFDDSRREEILKDTQLRRQEFENILKTRLYALAALKSSYGKSASQKRRVALIDQRVVTQYFFETHLRTNGGFTRAEIEARYKADPGKFSDADSILPLSRVRSKVVDDLILGKADLDSFHQANSASYKVPAWVEASVIRTNDSAQAKAALKALKGGMKFSDAAARFSVHASKANGGRIDRVNDGEGSPALGEQPTLDTLFFNEKTRLTPGGHSNFYRFNNGYVIAGLDAFHPERIAPLAEVRARVEEEYVRSRREADANPVIEALKAKYKVRLISLDREPTQKEIQAYYNAHKDEYTSPETFELYHAEAKDSATLAKAFAQVATLDQFKAAAARVSDNSLTQAQEGLLGWVKRDFVLPYGVGVMPSLFPLLDEASSGKIAEILENPTTQKWHIFWLAGKAPGAVKSLDRVRGTVLSDLKANFIASVKPGDTLAVIEAGKKVLREEDVLFLRREIPEQMQDRYTRESLVNYLLVWHLATDEATALGLDKDRALRALRLQSEDSYWAGIYRDSILPSTWEQSPSVLEKAFKANLSLFVRDSTASRKWKDHARDIAAWLTLTPSDLKIEYHTFPERYMRDSAAIPFAQALPAIFDALRQTAYARLEDAVFETLKKRFKVAIEDPALKEPSLEPTAAAYKKAQDLHYERKLDQSLSLYGKLRDGFPQRAGLQDSVSFGIAQIYLEQERFPQALAEYRRVSYLYPNSANDYKAMFMVGFIQSEHLRQDSAAVRSFEAMLKKHPESDLSDDAEWMIRNIRSGGKLMPSLEDDSTSTEPGAAK